MLSAVALAGCDFRESEWLWQSTRIEEAHGAELPAAVSSPHAAVPSLPVGYHPIGRSSLVEGGRRFDWPGSGLRARFRGRALRIELEERGRDDVSVWLDGVLYEPLRTLARGEQTLRVEVADDDEHVVELGKRTEARDGHFVVRQVSVEAGVLLPIAPRLRVEVIGDSISAGFGLAPSRADGSCSFASRESDAMSSYAALFARARALDLTLLAVSSQTTRQMTAFYQRAWPEPNAPRWSGDDSLASAVLVLLGTNDFFQRDPGQATFVHDTTTLLARIRAAHGAEVPVVLMLSPMLSDAYPAGARHRTLARRYLRATLERARRAGDAALHLLELDLPSAEHGLGCSSHPSAATHRAMAAQLAHFFDQEHVVR